MIQQSESIAALIAALAKARLSFGAVVKDKSNPAFPKSKYADLENVIGATFKALSENGLAVIQSPGSYSPETHCAQLTTILAHSSGEWIKETMEMPVGKSDSWGVGSAVTYARRYSYQGFVNVAAEPDDDGAASREQHESSTEKTTKEKPLLNATQERAFWAAVAQGKKTEPEVRAYLKETLGIPDADKCPKTALASKILKANLDDAMKWAVTASDLTGELTLSVEWTQASKKLWATANEAGVPEADVKRYSYENFNVKSMKDLVPAQLAHVTAWVKDQKVPF